MGVWDRGNRSKSYSVVNEQTGSGCFISVNGTHKYTAPGVCTVSLHIIKREGAGASNIEVPGRLNVVGKA